MSNAQGGNTQAELEAQKALQEEIAERMKRFAGYFIRGTWQRVDARYANDDDVVALYVGPKP
jgi:hypothetical protein